MITLYKNKTGYRIPGFSNFLYICSIDNGKSYFIYQEGDYKGHLSSSEFEFLLLQENSLKEKYTIKEGTLLYDIVYNHFDEYFEFLENQTTLLDQQNISKEIINNLKSFIKQQITTEYLYRKDEYSKLKTIKGDVDFFMIDIYSLFINSDLMKSYLSNNNIYSNYPILFHFLLFSLIKDGFLKFKYNHSNNTNLNNYTLSDYLIDFKENKYVVND